MLSYCQRSLWGCCRNARSLWQAYNLLMLLYCLRPLPGRCNTLPDVRFTHFLILPLTTLGPLPERWNTLPSVRFIHVIVLPKAALGQLPRRCNTLPGVRFTHVIVRTKSHTSPSFVRQVLPSHTLGRLSNPGSTPSSCRRSLPDNCNVLSPRVKGSGVQIRINIRSY